MRISDYAINQVKKMHNDRSKSDAVVNGLLNLFDKSIFENVFCNVIKDIWMAKYDVFPNPFSGYIIKIVENEIVGVAYADDPQTLALSDVKNVMLVSGEYSSCIIDYDTMNVLCELGRWD